MARPTFASVLPGIIAACAFLTSMFAGLYCKFISFTSTSGGNNPITLYFGIWYYQGWSVVDTAVQGTVVLETCYNYPDGTDFDAPWKSAKAFSTMTLIIGGLVTFWVLFLACFFPSKMVFNKAGGLVFLICCLFQGLSILFLNSNACHDNALLESLNAQLPNVDLTFQSSCSMGPGAKCAIAGTVLWFVAAVLSMRAGAPPPADPLTTRAQDVTYTRTTGPDGTPLLSEQVVHGEPVAAGV